MGKCGGRELNYASDVDVIFVAAPAGDATEDTALRAATQLAAAMIRVCSQPAAEGPLFPVDPNLRPEGRDGPLVRTLASHRAYYERWAKTWEFQALLKARPVAGDADAWRVTTCRRSRPMVWQAAQRENFVADVQAMRRRVVDSLPADQAGRELKLGPGGLRDIEFAVQLLQLVHGRTDETLRVPATLGALAALAAGGYVGRQDAASLASRVPVPARCRAPAPAAISCGARTCCPRTRRCCAGSAARCGSASRRAGGRHADPAAELTSQWRQHASQVTAAAREALLPAAARGGRPAARRGRPADAGSGAGPARGARLR